MNMAQTAATLSESNNPSTGNYKHSPSRIYWKYCMAALLVPAACMIAMVFYVRSDSFIARSGNTYLANMGYGMRLRGADCKILIYGDSSAMVGIDPAILTARTGLSACNIAEFAGMTILNGMIIPDEFLKKNPRPKYFVFMFAPEDLAKWDHWGVGSLYEAFLFRIRTQPNLGTAALLSRHLPYTFDFIEMAMRLTLSTAMKRTLSPADYTLREQRRGFLAVPGPPISVCDPEQHDHAPDPRWIQAIRSKYGIGGTTVLVDVVPEPTCDPSFGYYQPRVAGITDNGLHAYPISMYNGSGRLHFTAAGAQRISNEVADQIESKMHGEIQNRSAGQIKNRRGSHGG